jgi:hypothetical protein
MDHYCVCVCWCLCWCVWLRHCMLTRKDTVGFGLLAPRHHSNGEGAPSTALLGQGLVGYDFLASQRGPGPLPRGLCLLETSG